jgi:hypothetical protein
MKRLEKHDKLCLESRGSSRPQKRRKLWWNWSERDCWYSLPLSLSLSVHLCPAPTSSPKELQSLESTAVSA